MLRPIAWLLGIALLGGALVWGTLQEAQVKCEVCVDYGGGSTCRTAVASDRDGALRAAIRGACAVLSTGVTSGMACDRTPPSAIRCED